jgi:hypothetical protein
VVFGTEEVREDLSTSQEVVGRIQEAFSRSLQKTTVRDSFAVRNGANDSFQESS